MTTQSSQPNASSTVVLQRLEGGVMLVLGVVVYIWLGQSWWLFALLFFVPDLSMLGYLSSTRTGMLAYNLVHTYLAPGLLALLSLAVGPMALGLAAIWTAHIGFDRLLGYGLKLSAGFQHTHLGPIGRASRSH